MNKASQIHMLIGNTPLMPLDKFAQSCGLSAGLFGKLEMFNPGGSVKDRVAFYMIRCAEREGKLKPGGVIVEPTSGNTGIGLAVAGAAGGYRVMLVMPESMSDERKRLIKSYGATLILTPGKDGMRGAIAEAERLAAATPGAFMPGQFTNPHNPEAHVLTTGPEILSALPDIDVFVAGVGTGGTVTGVGRYLKTHKPGVFIAAVEPNESAVLSGKPSGAHRIQGIGAGFIPDILDRSVIDEVIPVPGDDAVDCRNRLAQIEGLSVGISSGAALMAAVTLAARPDFKDARIAVLFPDGGERYLSVL